MALSVELGADGAPPTEFRIFTPGWNKSTKGDFLFDAQAAASVIKAYEAWGVDKMIDLEHQSLDEDTPVEPTARDARGWAKLELRDGELWAVGVTWTPDGAQRLSEKRQRYVSPAFAFDKKTKRIESVLNIAICAIPATHHTPALVAAKGSTSMAASPLPQKLVSSALEAVASKDAKGSLTVLQQILAALLGGDPEDAAPPLGDGGADDATEADPAAAMAADPAAAAEDDKKKKGEDAVAAAAGRYAMKLTGINDPAKAMVELARRSKVAEAADASESRTAADRVTMELSRYRANAATLVKLGAETPATAWTDSTAKVPCERLLAEPLDAQDARIKALSAGGVKRAAGVVPPVVAVLDENGLDARELAICKEQNCDPKTFAMLKARRSGATATA